MALASLLGLALVACRAGGPETLTDRLIIARNDGLYEVSLAGAQERLLILSRPDSMLLDPAVSQDGQQIAFVRQLTGAVFPGEPADLGSDIYVADRNGGGTTLVRQHQTPGEILRSPAWLPTGEALLFVVQRSDGGRLIVNIEVQSLMTGRSHVLVEDAFEPAVSRDGKQIAYLRTREDLGQGLWLASADGGAGQLLVGAGEAVTGIGAPRFSPDGRFIAFSGSNPPEPPVALDSPALFVSRRVGSRRGWSVPATYNGYPMDIWTVELDGGRLRKVAAMGLDSPSLAWSDDGRHIFVLASSGLFSVDHATGSWDRVAVGTHFGQLDWLAAE